MTRFIMPIVLIGIAVALFFTFTNPLYNSISELKSKTASYSTALDNSKALENERDKLTAKYNKIDPENLVKLQKLLPDNVNNIRLILEIEKIATPYGMVLKNVKYNAADKNAASTTGSAVLPGGVDTTPKDYGAFDLEFSTTGSYYNFINFTKDLESNLRIVDISSIAFSSDTGSPVGKPAPEIYTYDFKIKTYWLKN